MFDIKDKQSLKQKQKEHDWRGIFKQLKGDDAEFSKENSQIDDECYTNEQNEFVNKMIHTKMDQEFRKIYCTAIRKTNQQKGEASRYSGRHQYAINGLSISSKKTKS